MSLTSLAKLEKVSVTDIAELDTIIKNHFNANCESYYTFVNIKNTIKLLEELERTSNKTDLNYRDNRCSVWLANASKFRADIVRTAEIMDILLKTNEQLKTVINFSSLD